MIVRDGISNEINMLSNDNEVLLDILGLAAAAFVGLMLGAL
tara:strand:- start:489 stop:611 length:123 start_codon:yes stop_codon:yes gene_type:complete